jgi:hypothetical protein
MLVDTRIRDDQLEQSVVEQRLGKRLFSQQQRDNFRDNGEMNCSIWVSPVQYAKQI